jgi:hypothetical protein
VGVYNKEKCITHFYLFFTTTQCIIHFLYYFLPLPSSYYLPTFFSIISPNHHPHIISPHPYPHMRVGGIIKKNVLYIFLYYLLPLPPSYYLPPRPPMFIYYEDGVGGDNIEKCIIHFFLLSPSTLTHIIHFSLLSPPTPTLILSPHIFLYYLP